MGADHRVESAVPIQRQRRTAMIVDPRSQRQHPTNRSISNVAYPQLNPGRISFGTGRIEPPNEEIVTALDQLAAHVVAGPTIGTARRQKNRFDTHFLPPGLREKPAFLNTPYSA